MNRLLIFCVLVLLLSRCGPTAEVSNSDFKAGAANRIDPFKPADALQIVGAPIHQTTCDTMRTNSRLIFNSEFTANEPDSLGREAVVYYMYTEFSDHDSAVDSYVKIRRANLQNGVQDLAAVGDYAYVHTDTANFYYGMILKGNKEVRIKLSKIVTTSTRENFLAVMNRIGGAL